MKVKVCSLLFTISLRLVKKRTLTSTVWHRQVIYRKIVEINYYPSSDKKRMKKEVRILERKILTYVETNKAEGFGE